MKLEQRKTEALKTLNIAANKQPDVA